MSTELQGALTVSDATQAATDVTERPSIFSNANYNELLNDYRDLNNRSDSTKGSETVLPSIEIDLNGRSDSSSESLTAPESEEPVLIAQLPDSEKPLSQTQLRETLGKITESDKSVEEKWKEQYQVLSKYVRDNAAHPENRILMNQDGTATFLDLTNGGGLEMVHLRNLSKQAGEGSQRVITGDVYKYDMYNPNRGSLSSKNERDLSGIATGLGHPVPRDGRTYNLSRLRFECSYTNDGSKPGKYGYDAPYQIVPRGF